MIPEVTAAPAGRHLRELASVLWRRRIGRLVVHTASYSVASARCGRPGRHCRRTRSGAGNAMRIRCGHGVVRGGNRGRRHGPARGVLLPVAHDPGNARGYVATSRAMMLVTGTAALAAGILLAPILARGNTGLTAAYRIAFAASIVAFVGASCTSSLEAKNLRWWNTVRVSQPAPGIPSRIAAAADAHAGCRADRPGPHHARPARLGPLPLPVSRTGTRPGQRRAATTPWTCA